jgi:Fic family protein
MPSFQDASATTVAILRMRDEHRSLVETRRASANALRLLDYLFRQPVVDARTVSGQLGVTFQTANTLLRDFQHLGLLDEMTGQRRGRRYRYTPYLRLFDQPVTTAR